MYWRHPPPARGENMTSAQPMTSANIMVKQVVPSQSALDESGLLSLLQQSAEQGRRPPFSDDTIAFCDRLSQLIFDDPEARELPELVSLAFFLRKASIHKLKESFPVAIEGAVRAPKGLVFHIPPRNVETIMIYSWLFSFLCGNPNVIRISDQTSNQTAILCRLLRGASKTAGKSIQAGTIILSYGHEEHITKCISDNCQMRVIWGGDRTIDSIRAVPLPAGAHELTFFDRNSVAAIKSSAYAALPEKERDELCKKFFNDVYLFDQQACSSPRLLVWVAAKDDAFDKDREDFKRRLAAVIKAKDYSLSTAQILEKQSYMFNAALEQPVSGHTQFGNELSFFSLESLSQFKQACASESSYCGCGLLFEFAADSLQEISTAVGGSCQTMTHFGFQTNELQQLATGLLGRGIDRMVPIGQALQFNRYWDGYDLLAEFSRLVYIESAS
jgi:hypothetical protein